jgi:hypothetical protein
MRARVLAAALLLLALPLTVFAGDGDKAAEKPASEKDKKAAAAQAAAAQLLKRPAPQDLDEALRRMGRIRVSVKFSEMPFRDVVEYVGRVAGFNVIIAPALQAKGVDGIKPITMTLSDVSLRQLTDLVTQFSGTKFKLEQGVLQFTTPEDACGKPVLRIYSIGDLTIPLRNFPGPDMNLRPSNSEFEDEPESEVPNAWSDPQKVVEMIQKMCSEETWTDKDVSISADENKLIVRQYPEVHREIVRLISLLRAAR